MGIYVFLSPAKQIRPVPLAVPTQAPVFGPEAEQAVLIMAGKSPAELMKQQKTSRSVAEQNALQWARWGKGAVHPAAGMYHGEAFKSLGPESWSGEDWAYAAEHLWIGSGLYGILRATDGVEPYRLEMNDRHPATGEPLTAFWKSKITSYLHEQLPPDALLLNLMSDEYSRAIDWEALQRPVVSARFLEKSPQGYKTIQVYLKKARGMLADFVIQNRLDSTDDIKNFQGNRYIFDENKSTTNTFLFNQKS